MWKTYTLISPACRCQRVYEVADECRRRARSWAQMADALEARVRRGSTAT